MCQVSVKIEKTLNRKKKHLNFNFTSFPQEHHLVRVHALARTLTLELPDLGHIVVALHQIEAGRVEAAVVSSKLKIQKLVHLKI